MSFAGANHEETPFSNNDAAPRELTNETLKKIAIELTRYLRRCRTVDWSVRETVRARLRLMVNIILKENKYLPEKVEGRYPIWYWNRRRHSRNLGVVGAP